MLACRLVNPSIFRRRTLHSPSPLSLHPSALVGALLQSLFCPHLRNHGIYKKAWRDAPEAHKIRAARVHDVRRTRCTPCMTHTMHAHADTDKEELDRRRHHPPQRLVCRPDPQDLRIAVMLRPPSVRHTDPQRSAHGPSMFGAHAFGMRHTRAQVRTRAIVWGHENEICNSHQ